MTDTSPDPGQEEAGCGAGRMIADLLLDRSYLGTVIEHGDPDAPVAPQPHDASITSLGLLTEISASNDVLAALSSGPTIAAVTA